MVGPNVAENVHSGPADALPAATAKTSPTVINARIIGPSSVVPTGEPGEGKERRESAQPRSPGGVWRPGARAAPGDPLQSTSCSPDSCRPSGRSPTPATTATAAGSSASKNRGWPRP